MIYRDEYNDETSDRTVLIIWQCSSCGSKREDPPGYNEGGQHYACGGEWEEVGESYEV